MQDVTDAACAAKSRAVASAGGGAAVAQRLGISRSAVGHWAVIPARHIMAMERLTGIPAAELRPDLAAAFASATP
jgi:hypothetical protein